LAVLYFSTILPAITTAEAGMRYIIYGAGGVGGVVGGRLFQAGHDVVLICRGAHLEAIQRDGLRLRTPEEDLRLRVPAVSHPRALTFGPDDVAVLTMKTQDTERALADLQAAGGDELPIVCCQNGVENERLAARRFGRVYAMLVALPATFMQPGEVSGESIGVSGVLDLGCYPSGVDDLAARMAADLSVSRLDSRPDPQVMRLKYTKLLSNLGNAIQAITGEMRGSAIFQQVATRLRAEAEACYAVAGIQYTPEDEYNERIRSRYQIGEIAGRPRAGSSTWQSFMRGSNTVETDYLNGEIVLLGKLHGVPTPLNAVLRRITTHMAASGEQPGRYTVADLLAMATEAVGSRQ
jgi:2-dehydropantoate 2-reductase